MPNWNREVPVDMMVLGAEVVVTVRREEVEEMLGRTESVAREGRGVEEEEEEEEEEVVEVLLGSL